MKQPYKEVFLINFGPYFGASTIPEKGKETPLLVEGKKVPSLLKVESNDKRGLGSLGSLVPTIISLKEAYQKATGVLSSKELNNL